VYSIQRAARKLILLRRNNQDAIAIENG